MIVNGFLYKDKINDAMKALWYDEKYQYYFCGPHHYDMWFGGYEGRDTDSEMRVFASVDKDGELIGAVKYSHDAMTRSAYSFGAINFTDKAATFGRDLYQVIDDIFCKFNMNRIGFSVVCGNPIEKSYDRLVAKFGGIVTGIEHQNTVNIRYELCDMKNYEILQKDYLKAKERIYGKRNNTSAV